MSYGVKVFDGNKWRRPKSKAEMRRVMPGNMLIESTNEHEWTDGLVINLPNGAYPFVGPDIYNDRRFYGTIVIAENGQVFIR